MTTTVAPKIDFEKLREIMKDLALKDIVPMLLTSVGFLKISGQFLIVIGNIQKRNKELYEFAMKVGENPEAFLALFVDRVPEEKLKPFIELILRLSSIQTKMKDFKALNADEKIILGKELKEIATKMNELLKELEK